MADPKNPLDLANLFAPIASPVTTSEGGQMNVLRELPKVEVPTVPELETIEVPDISQALKPVEPPRAQARDFRPCMICGQDVRVCGGPLRGW